MFPLGPRANAFLSRTAATRRFVAKPSEIFLHVLDEEPNTALIRVGGNHDFLRSPVDAFALIRDVERRFGAVRDFQVRRDYDQNARYQAFVQVAFKNPASYQLLPSLPKEFEFERPSVDSNQPGGIGLKDLKPFLQPTSGDASPSFPESIDLASGTNTISYRVSRCKNNIISPSMYTKVSDVSSQTARLFLQWGGFHSLKPISSEIELSIKNAFSPTSIDRFRMRCALRRYSEMIPVPNPYEIPPGQETTPQEQDPPQVPDPKSVSQDSPMPSDVLVDSQTPDLPASLSSSDAPTPHPHPSSTTSTISTSSTQPEPDTTSPSPTLESSSFSAQPEASAQEPVATAPPPAPSPSLTPVQPKASANVTSSAPSPSLTPSKALPKSIAEAQAIATKLQKQAKSMNRVKQKKEQKRREKEANPLPNLSKQKPAQPSMRDVTKGIMEARQAADAKRTVVEKPKTMREKIAGFFSGLF